MMIRSQLVTIRLRPGKIRSDRQWLFDILSLDSKTIVPNRSGVIR